MHSSVVFGSFFSRDYFIKIFKVWIFAIVSSDICNQKTREKLEKRIMKLWQNPSRCVKSLAIVLALTPM